MSDPALVVVLGPTASGKTALAVTLAERFGGEIVSCDSVSIYRELVIGTAKPTDEERRRAPHHLLDVVSIDETFTAGDYARAARQALAELSGRGRMPIVAGGSGLYLRAMLEGLFAGPPRSEELRARLRDRAAQRGSPYLHRLLARRDPRAAEAIHPNDAPKLIRALEVSLLARRPMSALWQEGREPLRGFRVLRLGLDPERALLYERINRRAEAMFEAGLVEETRALLARYARSSTQLPGESDVPAVLNSLGYRQAAQLLRGELTCDGAIAAAQQGHRNYAKRQMTWFRREPEVSWIAGFGNEPRVEQWAVEQVDHLVRT